MKLAQIASNALMLPFVSAREGVQSLWIEQCGSRALSAFRCLAKEDAKILALINSRPGLFRRGWMSARVVDF